VPSSVWSGEDRDELSHLRTLVSLERVLGGLVDQVLALSLELLDQLLPESRKRVLIDSSSGLMRSWATPGCLFRGEGMHPCRLRFPPRKFDPATLTRSQRPARRAARAPDALGGVGRQGGASAAWDEPAVVGIRHVRDVAVALRSRAIEPGLETGPEAGGRSPMPSSESRGAQCSVGFPSASAAWACDAGISGSCDTSPIP
jgi:hypothetical protein